MIEAVVDASVVASWLLPDEKGGVYDAVLNKIHKVKLHVPSIFVYELLSILIVAEKRGRLSPALQERILSAVSRLPIIIESLHPVIWKHDNVLQTAKAYNLTPYDAAYFELSVRLGGLPVLTYDKTMIEVAKKFKHKTHV